jgi:hypothetical protein
MLRSRTVSQSLLAITLTPLHSTLTEKTHAFPREFFSGFLQGAGVDDGVQAVEEVCGDIVNMKIEIAGVYLFLPVMEVVDEVATNFPLQPIVGSESCHRFVRESDTYSD